MRETQTDVTDEETVTDTLAPQNTENEETNERDNGVRTRTQYTECVMSGDGGGGPELKSRFGYFEVKTDGFQRLAEPFGQPAHNTPCVSESSRALRP